jgi:hypothetical protein
MRRGFFMKTKWIAVLACAAAPLLAADSGAMTAAERAYLIEQLEQSKKNVPASIQGVTEAQWSSSRRRMYGRWPSAPSTSFWRRGYIFGASQQALKTPAVPRLATANAEADRKLVAAIQDRSKKATAPEPITPSGKFATPADAVREFTARRDKTIAYVKTTQDDLRAHTMEGPAGPMDAYQFLLLLASHSARHTAQIREVQDNPGYPKP